MPAGFLLLEHQGKMLLRRAGIQTPRGRVVTGPASLAAALDELPEKLVLKAQIAAGGRGKSGGILFADNRAEAVAGLDALLGKIVAGQVAKSVLIEERLTFAHERYAGIMIDAGELSLMFARQGGIGVEEMSAGDPSNFHELIIDPIVGPTSLQLDECFEKLDVPRDRRAAYEDVAQKLLQIGRDCDATMVEINPLVELPDGSLVALDARVAVDDAALARRPEIADMLGNLNPADGGPGGLRPSAEAGLLSLRRNPQGGAIGLIGLGGGLNMTLMDWIASAGSAVGAVIDIDPALAEGKAEAGFIGAFGDLDRDPSIRAILVNVITCGYRLDDIVYALARALRGRNPDAKPMVLHLRGNGMEATPKFLNAAGRRNSASLRHAVAEIVRAAGN